MIENAQRDKSLLEVGKLTVTYSLPSEHIWWVSRRFNAVDGVDLSVKWGESVGLVGETGCGKSSLSRAICGLTPVSSGTVHFKGIDTNVDGKAQRRTVRREMQMIFQDPGGSLNPRMRVGKLIAEPLEIHRIGDRHQRMKRVFRILDAVGLSADDADRFPHEFSGGQRQRIAIARAVVVEPALILADEPVSALDVSLQAQILNLIVELRRKFGLALLFVSHDLHVVHRLCRRVAVMYLGQIIESGPTEAVLVSPRHPYTRALVASSPRPDPDQPIRLVAGDSEPPNPASPPKGCRYHPRCPHATDLCAIEPPVVRHFDAGRSVACHHFENINGQEDLWS